MNSIIKEAVLKERGAQGIRLHTNPSSSLIAHVVILLFIIPE